MRVADRAEQKRVKPARLRCFRLGADKSPAPSAQALPPNRYHVSLFGRETDPRHGLPLARACLVGILGGVGERPAPIVLVVVLVLEIPSTGGVAAGRGGFGSRTRTAALRTSTKPVTQEAHRDYVDLREK